MKNKNSYFKSKFETIINFYYTKRFEFINITVRLGSFITLKKI